MPAIVDNPIRELAGVDPRALPDAVLCSTTPVVLRGLVDAWPLVRAARASAEDAAAYLQRFDHGALPANAMVEPPAVDGRIFYDESVPGFTLRRARVPRPVDLNLLLKYTRAEERRGGKEGER